MAILHTTDTQEEKGHRFARKNPFSRIVTDFCGEILSIKRNGYSGFKIIVALVYRRLLIALPFNDVIEEKFNNYVVVAIALIVYGILFIVIENYNKRRRPTCTNLENLSFKTALIIGLFQVLSVVPGTSRSGSTIIGGILAGTSRTVAAEFTFFLGIPVMFGASLLKILKFGFSFTGTEVNDPDRGNGSSICSFHYRDQIPDGIHKET